MEVPVGWGAAGGTSTAEACARSSASTAWAPSPARQRHQLAVREPRLERRRRCRHGPVRPVDARRPWGYAAGTMAGTTRRVAPQAQEIERLRHALGERDRQVADLQDRVAEALEQQAATADILRIISASPARL